MNINIIFNSKNIISIKLLINFTCCCCALSSYLLALVFLSARRRLIFLVKTLVFARKPVKHLNSNNGEKRYPEKLTQKFRLLSFSLKTRGKISTSSQSSINFFSLEIPEINKRKLKKSKEIQKKFGLQLKQNHNVLRFFRFFK